MGGTEPLQKQPYLFQPVATLTSFSFAEVVEEVRATYFPQLERSVEVRVSVGEALASCHFDFMGRGKHMVRFHPILNHPRTPLPVVQHIAKHELTHALMPWANHTPEFWAHERAIGPEWASAWRWLHENFGRAARHTERGYIIFRTWRRAFRGPRTAYQPELPLDPDRYENLCPGDGQLMLPPEWSPQPLPLGAT